VELDPPRGLKYEYLVRRACQLADMGVDAITSGDNPVAMLRMGNLAFAQLIQQESGLPCVVHLSCRDRNLLGMQSYLLAAELMGIQHVLALTGDPARVGDQPGATSVYDINSFGLIELITRFNKGCNHAGMEIGRPTHFKIGVALNPHGRNLEARIQRLRRKYQCGAHFAMSQPVFEPEMVFRIKEAAQDIHIPIYIGLFPVLSERNAEYLHHEVPGVDLTESVLHRMKGLSGKAGREMGLRLCREVVEATADVVDGFYIVPPQGRTDTATALVAAIHECSPRFAAPRRR
jgi:5,10-methylenetetrahydrofolate reductase